MERSVTLDKVFYGINLITMSSFRSARDFKRITKDISQMERIFFHELFESRKLLPTCFY